MSAKVEFHMQLTFEQVAALAHQLPEKDRQRLARQLTAKATSASAATFDESKLTPDQRKTVANVRQGFKELKAWKEGRLQARPLSEVLNEIPD